MNEATDIAEFNPFGSHFSAVNDPTKDEFMLGQTPPQLHQINS
jgi:hypothetical protein